MKGISLSAIALFDDVDRVDPAGAAHAEGIFAFLNRVRSEFFGNVRDLLESWFERLPADAKAQVRGRFRSTDDRQVLGAFWELYLHEMFSRLGFRLTHEPAIAGVSTRPDFLVEGHGASFYLEATIVGTADAEVAAARRRSRAFDVLNRLQTDDFMLWLDVISEGSQDPRAARLRDELEGWLRELDAEEAVRGYEKRGLDGLPARVWAEDGWEIRFRAIPKKPEARGELVSRPIGAWGPGQASAIDTFGPIRRDLEQKASRYGELNRPFVIAVLCTDTFASDHSVNVALFGGEAYDFENDCAIRNPDGLWVGPKGIQNARVSAVLSAVHLNPWTVAQISPRVWPNPWAKRPLHVSLPFARTMLEVNGSQGSFEEVDSIGLPHELLSLPEDWPGAEDLEG